MELTVTDHLGRQVIVPALPQRIVSLCPSITETLYTLGLGKRVVGRTRFCIHPQPEVQQALRVGGTKEIRYERLNDLQPDLIIAEKEENTPEMVDHLALKYPVFVVDVQTIADAHRMILDIGSITQTQVAATQLSQRIQQAWQTLTPFSPKPRVAYFIWQDPLIVVGRDTYIQSVLVQLGMDNVFRNWPGRYPEVSRELLQQAAPDLILLSSEPYPFQEKHVETFRSISPQAEVQLVDGEMFSWYGSRMIQAAPYIRAWQRGLLRS